MIEPFAYLILGGILGLACYTAVETVRLCRARRRAADMVRAADEAMELLDGDQRERAMRHAMRMPPAHPESITAVLSDDEEIAFGEIAEHYRSEEAR